MEQASATLQLTFSVVILAGGGATRMGQDKGMLVIDGQLLLARQVALATSLQPVETLISGRPDADYTAFDCPVLMDAVPDAGPLAGIAVALEVARAPLLLVLAVDMPYVTQPIVARVLAACQPERGAVPRFANRLEPLLAVYPRAAASWAADQLRQRQLAVRAFAARCQQAGLASFVDLPPSLAPAFRSWNRPEDRTTALP